MTSSADKGCLRIEKDALGEMKITKTSLTGIHTARAMENFSVSANSIHQAWFRAMGWVKLAAAITNRDICAWKEEKAIAIIKSCRMLADGKLDQWNRTNALQGGAGTSLNMNCNEVIANQALIILGKQPGDYQSISPLDDVNRHQSTNDTVPTALRIAVLFKLDELEAVVVELQEAFQEAEKKFADVIKVGRTQLQDAVLTTLGRSFSAFSDLLSRDRWRLFKCKERLRVVNLGGTAIGSGLGAPREYIFSVCDVLRDLTGLPLNRAENLVEATQNQDVFAEVSGIIRTYATSLLKISRDLRLLSSGPETGIGEIELPAVQAGSSIMPGKTNPVIPEAVQQAAMQYLGRDTIIAHAVASADLELNPFLPVIGDNLLRGMDELVVVTSLLSNRCVKGINVNRENLRRKLGNSTALATALVTAIGYQRAEVLLQRAKETGKDLIEVAEESGYIAREDIERLISLESVLRLGSEEDDG